MTEAENASVRTINDGGDDVAQHRCGYVALRARHIAIKEKEEKGKRKKKKRQIPLVITVSLLKGVVCSYLRVVGGEETIEGEHFRSGHSYTAVVGCALMMIL